MNDLPDRELTPTELRQLIESNARSIQANSAAIAETRETLEQGFVAVQRDLSRLANLMEQYFTYQSSTNQSHTGGLEDHEQRISRLEGGQS